MSEFALIDLIRRRTAQPRGDVALGIGDDAALLRVPARHDLVAAMDTLVAGVHFPVETRAQDIGWKALAVNLSDLAAMGARPAWATLALTLPAADARWVGRFAQGFGELARLHRVALVGGDTTRGPLTVTVQAEGFAPRGAAVRRAGAKVGDAIFVSGSLGDAAAGLALVQEKIHAGPRDARALRRRLDRPLPRVELGLALRGIATACIDVSDGLAADLGHVLEASAVGAQVDLDSLPSSPALRRAVADPTRRQQLQLGGGDDYELCFCVAERALGRIPALARKLQLPLTRIGTIGARRGAIYRGGDGKRVAPTHSGWDHFAR